MTSKADLQEYHRVIGEISSKLSLLEQTIIFMLSLYSTTSTVGEIVCLLHDDQFDFLHKKFIKVLRHNFKECPALLLHAKRLERNCKRIRIARNTLVHSYWFEKNGHVYRKKFMRTMETGGELVDAKKVKLDVLQGLSGRITHVVDDIWETYIKHQVKIGQIIDKMRSESNSL